MTRKWMLLGVCLLGACSGDWNPFGATDVDLGSGGPSLCTGRGGATTREYVIDSINLPTGGLEHAIDLNGDGSLDNAFSRLVLGLASMNADLQSSTDAALRRGSDVLLVSVVDAPPQPSCAADTAIALLHGARFNAAVTDAGVMGGPDFSGAGAFAVDPAQSGDRADLIARPGGAIVSSESPVTTANPVSFVYHWSMLGDMPDVDLRLHGVHIQFNSSDAALASGEIHGSVRSDELLQAIAVPIAKYLTGHSNQMCWGVCIPFVFDAGGCTNPDGTRAVEKDGKIDVCEVTQNPTIRRMVAPDVQIFQDGHYAPQKIATAPDSVSFGVGFTAVRARY